MQPGRDLALVTGASSGIGEEFARQLAARRIDLIITARRRDRLEALAAQLSADHGVHVAVIENDLNQRDGAQRLLDELVTKGLSPTILINNAGFGLYSKFEEQPLEDIDAMLEVDIRAVTLLSRGLAAEMVKQKHGYILNVSSVAGVAPIPRYSVYSGAKAYLVGFSQAIRHELVDKGVKVSVVCPGFTKSEFHDVSGHAKTTHMKKTELTPEFVCRVALKGLERGQLMIIPGAWYTANAILAGIIPRETMSSMTASVVK